MNQNIDKNLQALKAALKQDPEAAKELNKNSATIESKDRQSSLVGTRTRADGHGQNTGGHNLGQ